MKKLNKIHHVDNGFPHIDLRGFIVFNDNWICTNHTHLVNAKTGDKYKILEIKYHISNEWDNPTAIQHKAAIFMETKRTAVKVENQQTINNSDCFIAETY